MTTADQLRAGGPAESLLLTPEEAARLLRIGRTTVYALMKAGDLHPVHIGRSCRLARAELERYVNRLHAPEPIARRPRPRRRTSTDQGGLFEIDGEFVDESASVDYAGPRAPGRGHTRPGPTIGEGVSHDGRR